MTGRHGRGSKAGPLPASRPRMSTGRYIVAWLGSIMLALIAMGTILALAGK